MIYTRQMMKPEESFILIRTGEVYTVAPFGVLVFNENRKKWTTLHGNCHVQPITKKEGRMTETVASSCKDCYSRTQGYPCIYDVTCQDCREALLLAQPCKIIRKDMAESLEKRWGPVGDWKREPHCGCGKQCQLLQNKREADENLKAKKLQNLSKRRK